MFFLFFFYYINLIAKQCCNYVCTLTILKDNVVVQAANTAAISF